MPELGSLGSVRGALSNGCPYRDLRCAESILISLNTRQSLRFDYVTETPASFRRIIFALSSRIVGGVGIAMSAPARVRSFSVRFFSIRIAVPSLTPFFLSRTMAWQPRKHKRSMTQQAVLAQ